MENHEIIQRFKEKSEAMGTGFSVVIELEENGFCYWTWVDDYTCAVSKHNGGEVVVQAGSLSFESAMSISELYGRNPTSYYPSRYTDGSFVIIDSFNHKVFLGRDSSQAYHLYVWFQDTTLFISTSIIPFLGTVSMELDPIGCGLYTVFNITLAPFPLYKKIKPLLPGHYLLFNDLTQKSKPDLESDKIFWQVEPIDVDTSYKKAINKYEELLTTNILRHINNNTAGVFLSGGSDSAVAVAILSKILDPLNVVAGFMDTGSYTRDENNLVKILQKKYGFSLSPVLACFKQTNWKDIVNGAIRKNLEGTWPTFPAYLEMGRVIGEKLQKGSTTFNGELCLLDQGFNASDDRTRQLRRWLFKGPGRSLAFIPPILPHGARQIGQKLARKWRKYKTFLEVPFAFLHSIGRPAYFYGGYKAGFIGFPGIWQSYYGKYFSNSGLDVALGDMLVEKLFSNYVDRLASREWKQALATMSACWYSEASNMTMPLHAAISGSLAISFPFSDVDLMDYASSLPIAWTIDKKIQKDMAFENLSMPSEVAYFKKIGTGAGSETYFDIMYPSAQWEMLDEIKAHNYGLLQNHVDERIKLVETRKKKFGWQEFNLYCLAQYQKGIL
ncbi:MAG: hypothetical protein C4545_08795 [Anaerolineaceae bacterium]|jgi:hypothetical protein|nr:MAG: hypothetical protein C4545_08795 [Anaerolineaceae bacterium]